MEIQTLRVNEATVVALTGNLDSSTSTQLAQTFTAFAYQSRVRLIVDLAGVPHMDSSGLAALVSAMKQARKVGGNLALCAPQDSVRSVLDMTGLLKQIDVFPTRADALAAWQQRPSAASLEIDAAVFLVSTRRWLGTWRTVEGEVVPHRPGRSAYRWKVHLKDHAITSVSLKEIFTLPAPPEFWPVDSDFVLGDTDRTGMTERIVAAEDGWVSQGWRVKAGDPRGTYEIIVHLNGVFAHQFVFSVE